MSDALIGLLGSVIVAVIGYFGVTSTNRSANDKMLSSIQTAQAVTDTKIEALTEEVKKHNNFAQQIPMMQEQIKDISRRVDDLERGG